MDSPGAGGRRRGTTRVSAEDQALDQIAKEVNATFQTTLFSLPHRELIKLLFEYFKHIVAHKSLRLKLFKSTWS